MVVHCAIPALTLETSKSHRCSRSWGTPPHRAGVVPLKTTTNDP